MSDDKRQAAAVRRRVTVGGMAEASYGMATLGVDTRKIHANFDEHGGNMEIDYVVDMDHAVFGRNQFRINVREQERQTI